MNTARTISASKIYVHNETCLKYVLCRKTFISLSIFKEHKQTKLVNDKEKNLKTKNANRERYKVEQIKKYRKYPQ